MTVTRAWGGMTEEDLDQAVRQAADVFGWRDYHTYDSRQSAPGFPDHVLIRQGRLLAVELKADAGRVSKAQRAWLADFDRVPGCETYVWRPRDLLDGTIDRVLR